MSGLVVYKRINGSWRVLSGAAPIPSVPSAPWGVSVLAGNGQATASWQIPLDNGGANVTGYTVVVTDTTASSTTNVAAGSSPVVLIGLVNDHLYSFTVAAINSVGTGPASDPFTDVMPTANNSLLSWAPPTLVNPIDIYITNSNKSLTMDPAQDYRVHMPATPFDAKNGIQLIGGRNVVLIGGEINLSQVYGSDLGKNNRAIFIKGDATQTVPRTIHIEGLLIGGVLGEGVDIDSLSEPGLTIRFQNIRFNSELQGSYGTNHSDAIQAYNGPCHLEVDKLTAAICAYQGIFLQPFSFGDGPVEEYTFRRMNLTGTSTAGYMLWKSSPTLYDITVDRVWVSPAASKAGQPDQYLWHPQYWTGVQEGAPPGGDFVQVNDVGLNYVSPGYIN